MFKEYKNIIQLKLNWFKPSTKSIVEFYGILQKK